MALPEFSMRQLLEAGVHFGHQTARWNPRMSEFIYGSRNGIHIMDLTQTVPMLDAALNVVRETVAKGGRVLFVGTKRQAQGPIRDAAERSAQYYMNHRWLGGTLTNWKTVSQSINRLRQIDEAAENGFEGLTKKERLGMEREQAKLQASLGGIREMGGVPDLLFVIDVNKEDLAIAEARKLGIPVVAVVDTNCSPAGVDYIIPGNDDASRAISLYCDLAARAALDGMSAQLGAAGVDMGAMEELAEEELASEATAAAAAAEGETATAE
ncbi:30S ribosomal protein S2 [Ponticoccus sp. SC2-23]|uniref:30S ribosomal protein S2 n=1 Tax=Alexandriicola marinus TaxID=2081710 RepID=UPI000FD953AF|nr:30S ribosomal protein S2 [Alexandriicola marinus]MBM1218864.1 30S ribosomal protein S2 [Ponticoccus sp. SC6-9]MBM1224064.1 30S ribosomal protein S2 [Ponticoccus sp. SC6-15]MBM1230157.1 30S ribosomal protein S2 [Ponticoccus sp. SC6-38]MBM1233030.1 30S ribosomal protein S2 [Ponticoccus sp. SC6-45]MBM1237020.1 30S ribosomal protein S2 [Ponticoccus sp. SC6-49]MBM1242041.1 30S ribosomal protein S2 [Ponticoccus sp. SC2-64]MBM1246554.1 30S ribosomal protein S2 [Ponticoccus sp. SC6-42]MBM1251032